jgi:multisubunit Na+/H+ antiporter MnhG subunit
VTVREVFEAVLLVPGALLLLGCCAALLVLRSPYDRLHLLGAASVGVVLVAAAAVVRGPLLTLGVRGILVALLLVLGSPAVAVATMRATRAREHGHWEPQPGEAVVDR